MSYGSDWTDCVEAAIEAARAEGYNAGYNDGQVAGYDDGYRQGSADEADLAAQRRTHE